MRSCLLVLAATGALLVPSSASADKLLPGSTHTPPIKFDEPTVSIELYGNDGGYKFHSHMELTGISSKTDRVRLEWKSKGKVVATSNCGEMSYDGAYARGECDYDGKSITAAGEVTADLIYADDQTDKEYLVRTFKFTVVHVKGRGEGWQILADDTLGAAWVYQGHETDKDSTYRLPTVYMTFANGQVLMDAMLRCTIDGSKKLADISVTGMSGEDTEDIELTYLPTKGEDARFHWNRQKFLLNIFWGKRETLEPSTAKNTPPDGVLSDNPGKWECNLRKDGKVIRILNFVVNKDGMIINDEINADGKAIPTFDDKEVLIDLRFTKDSASWDQRIDPAAMKKSMAFGLPWPNHPKVKQIHASYPAKSGLKDPK